MRSLLELSGLTHLFNRFRNPNPDPDPTPTLTLILILTNPNATSGLNYFFNRFHVGFGARILFQMGWCELLLHAGELQPIPTVRVNRRFRVEVRVRDRGWVEIGVRVRDRGWGRELGLELL